MRKITLGVGISFLYIINSFANTIQSVTIGPMSGDTAASEFSMLIQLTPEKNWQNWEFGFYMPRPYISQQSFNPNLVMKICDANNTCSNLVYEKTTSVASSDKSAGYTTILAPATPFVLQKGQPYTIQLLHNNQWGPGNYSSVPQNFFMVVDNKVYTLPTQKDSYQLLNYDQQSINQQIDNHLTTNWNMSQPNVATNPIVPAPVTYTSSSGTYSLMANPLKIHNVLTTDNKMANLLQQMLAQNLSLRASVDNNTNEKTGIIIQKITPSIVNNNPEGYSIQIQSNHIIISAINDTGVFYALQTLRQLWQQNPNQLQNATIIDYPRFQYRGVLVDTARHLFTVDEMKKLIDVMAAHKLNTLHIHFADDEGFRLALNDFPTLTSIGATRAYGETIGPMLFLQGNLDITDTINRQFYPSANDIYKGHYSKEDIQTLIDYANANKITIIPEIDIPGHARALIKSLPNSFVDPNDHSSFVSVQGYTDNIIPVCTYNRNISVGPQFTQDITNIINHIAKLFSHQTTLYARNNEISVGADEVSSDAWSNDTSCQGDWANLTALAKAQKFFQEFAVNNTQLLLSGWQQLVQNDDQTLGNYIVPANQTAHIYVWNTSNNGIGQAISLAQNNYPTVLAFADQTYFDLTYTPDMTEPGFSWATPFSDTYAAFSSALSATNTVNGIANTTQKTNILGIEGTLWSENLATYDHLMYMALPKMAGLAEASWSPATTTVQNNQLNWQNLAARLGCGKTGFLAYLNKIYGVNYRGFPQGIKKEVPTGNLCPSL